MQVGLQDILALAGRLDDAPGFDTPRERYRRFLVTLVNRGAPAGGLSPAALPEFSRLIEQGQYTADEQHRRAVQDAVVVLGRLLGFETSFGSYERVAGVLKFDGLWRSPLRVELTLDVRTSNPPRVPVDLDDLARVVAALPSGVNTGSQTRRLGLCVVRGLDREPDGLDLTFAADVRLADIRIVSLNSLLWLAGAACAGRLRHHDVVRLLTAPGGADLVVEVLARMAATDTEPPASVETPASPHASSPASAPSPLSPDRQALESSAQPASAHLEPVATASPESASRHWLLVVEPDDGTTPEQYVVSVIGERRLLGIRNGIPGRPDVGDWICFSVEGRGIVGHARVGPMVDAPPPLREAHRYRAVFTLTDVNLYDVPRPVGPGVRSDPAASGSFDGAQAPLALLSGQQFAAFTSVPGPKGAELRVESVFGRRSRQSA